MNNPITTHILDTAKGGPAAGISAELEKLNESGQWERLGNGMSDVDGRINDLMDDHGQFSPGTFRLTFAVAPYFQSQNIESIYSDIPFTFIVQKTDQHYHIPLLLNPFGYSTYRGS